MAAASVHRIVGMMWAVVILAVDARGASINASFENHSHILVTTDSGIFIADLGVSTFVANNQTTDPLSRVTYAPPSP